MKVILGTAHGSNISGKCSPDKSIREYAWSREMCSRIKTELEKNNVDVVIDIEDDTEISLEHRVNIVNAICKQEGNSNCIYVSVHLNAAGGDGQWHNASGWTVWVSKNCSENSKKLALCLFDEAEQKNLFGNRCIPKTKYFPYNFYVLRNTLCPAVLTENMFQDNQKDVEYLLSEEGKTEICDLHVKGIINYISQFEE